MLSQSCRKMASQVDASLDAEQRAADAEAAEHARLRYEELIRELDDMPCGFRLDTTDTAAAKDAIWAAMAARTTELACGGRVEYRPGSGEWPVVLVAAHAGAGAAPPDAAGGFRGGDLYDVAESAFGGFSGYARGRAALVVVRLPPDASPVDGPRDAVAAADLELYDAFHDRVAAACAECVRKHELCLLLELRCQDRRPDVELNYLVPDDVLGTMTDEQLDADGFADETSVAALCRCDVKPALSRLLRSCHNLAYLLECKKVIAGAVGKPEGGVGCGEPARPGDGPRPAGAAGHALRRYGAPASLGIAANDWNRDVSAIQVEAPASFETDGYRRIQFGRELADVVRTYLWVFGAWIYKEPFVQPDFVGFMHPDDRDGGKRPFFNSEDFPGRDTSRYVGGCVEPTGDY